jgi:hypothetical protein
MQELKAILRENNKDFMRVTPFRNTSYSEKPLRAKNLQEFWPS